jgi:hypothetical protein
MMVLGRDCTITLKTKYREMGLPYSEETIREAVSLLVEQASIEGDGICTAIRQPGQQVGLGVTGCVVTPLSIETAPLLFALALGGMGQPLFISETRNLYRHSLSLLPMEDGPCFDLIQQRGNSRKLFEDCRVEGFELRINRGGGVAPSALKLRLDIRGGRAAVEYPYQELAETDRGERFSGDCVRYEFNGQENRDIYGLSISSKKMEGIKTEVKIHRVLRLQEVFPSIIEKLTITVQLYRERYERRHYGLFRLNLSRLVLMADETVVDCADAVIGPLRYYVAGGLTAEVFTNTDEDLA